MMHYDITQGVAHNEVGGHHNRNAIKTHTDPPRPPLTTVPPASPTAHNPEVDAGQSTCWSHLGEWLLGVWEAFIYFINCGSS
jgi:hypothetical protein